MDAIRNESHRAFPAKGAASPRSAYIPAPSIIPIPDTVTSKSPNLRFNDLIHSPPSYHLIFNNLCYLHGC